jgi:putative component of membrane protein insertase Oxa1/YidC/SpoIIIJ protein YidD
MLKHSCRWVLANGTYCEKKVKYHVVPDGGPGAAEKIRKYDPFCPTHMELHNQDDEY